MKALCCISLFTVNAILYPFKFFARIVCYIVGILNFLTAIYIFTLKAKYPLHEIFLGSLFFIGIGLLCIITYKFTLYLLHLAQDKLEVVYAGYLSTYTLTHAEELDTTEYIEQEESVLIEEEETLTEIDNIIDFQKYKGSDS